MDFKYYSFNWLSIDDNKWNLLIDFIKANTNIIELSEPIIPNFQNEKLNIHKIAENELSQLDEIAFFEHTIKPNYKYISYYDQQADIMRPKLFYRFTATNEMVDKLFYYKTANEFWENDFSLPAFYKDTYPIVWFADVFIVIGLYEIQKTEFIRNGFELELLENQNYPTKPIDNFNEIMGIRKTIKSVIEFGYQHKSFEYFQSFNNVILSSDDQKIAVIGKFYCKLFLRNLYSDPNFEINYAENCVDGYCDIQILNSGSVNKKILVKTVSIDSKTRMTSKIHHPDKFDELMVISLDMNLYPIGLWIVSSGEIRKSQKLIVPGYYLDFINEGIKIFKGSAIFKNLPNKIDEFNKLMGETYMINN